MKRQIRITAGSKTVLGELNETKTAEAIWRILSFSSQVNVWGQEVYFTVPGFLEREKGQEIIREVVNPGDLGYWPPGRAFCIFYGPTPASQGDEIRAASPVAVFGRLVDDPRTLKAVKDGETVAVEIA